MKPPMRYRDKARHKVRGPDCVTLILFWTGSDWASLDKKDRYDPETLHQRGFRYLKPDEQKGTEV